MTEDEKKEANRIKEQPVTYEMYVDMPDDGKRYEIINGTMELMSPGPSTTHQAVSGELFFVIRQSCISDYMIFHAPLDLILDKTNVFQPDILMVHRSRLHIVSERGVEGPPDFVVEIVSPGSRKRDKVIKLAAYASHDVPEYWVADPEARTIEQYRLADGGSYELYNLFEGNDTVTSDKLPCVSFPIHDIFKEIVA